MLILESIILGIVQGITEFLPISSSAHLIIIPWIFGWTDPAVRGLSFDVALHLGTLAAVIVYFRRDWVAIVGAWFKSIFQRKIGDDPNRKLAWFLLLGCVPRGIAGVLFESKIEDNFHGSPIPTAAMLLMAGVIALLAVFLLLADRLGKRERPLGRITLRDSIVIGLAQALAILPGVSRSGATMTTGLALGLDRESAARFSFLLAAPIIAGAGLKSAVEFAGQTQAGIISNSELLIFPIGLVTAAVIGFFCIKFLLTFLQKHSFLGFAVYRWALALVVLAFAFFR
jgi:undecaprenyl-diphosphatase